MGQSLREPTDWSLYEALLILSLFSRSIVRLYCSLNPLAVSIPSVEATDRQLAEHVQRLDISLMSVIIVEIGLVGTASALLENNDI
jgi:hypothetical protein